MQRQVEWQNAVTELEAEVRGSTLTGLVLDTGWPTLRDIHRKEKARTTAQYLPLWKITFVTEVEKS